MLTISGVLKVLLSEVCSHIDAGSRGNNVHLLTNHLFMSQLHFDGLAG